MATVTSTNQPDVILVGAGIMSATLAVQTAYGVK
jgi:hypothetical protein